MTSAFSWQNSISLCPASFAVSPSPWPPLCARLLWGAVAPVVAMPNKGGQGEGETAKEAGKKREKAECRR